MCDLVIKVGGGVLSAGELDAVLAAVADLSRSRRILIVPGGGPFADAVREADRRVGLPDEAAHWMAVLAMDQYAHLLAARLPAGVVVSSLRETTAALDDGRLPVLAPSRWLEQADPLPHTWDVTSDSIAAWVAGEADVRDLVLVKPRAAREPLVDPYFARALPRDLHPLVVTADRVGAVFAQLARLVHGGP